MIFQSRMWIGLGIHGSQLEIGDDWILMKQLEWMRTILHWETARNWIIRSWCFFNVHLWCNWNTSGFVLWYSKVATSMRKAAMNQSDFWGPHWHNQSQSWRWRGTATKTETGEFSAWPKSFRSGCDLWFLRGLYVFVTYECVTNMMSLDVLVCTCLHNNIVGSNIVIRLHTLHSLVQGPLVLVQNNYVQGSAQRKKPRRLCGFKKRSSSAKVRHRAVEDAQRAAFCIWGTANALAAWKMPGLPTWAYASHDSTKLMLSLTSPGSKVFRTGMFGWKRSSVPNCQWTSNASGIYGDRICYERWR